jgi:hypothetical protein
MERKTLTMERAAAVLREYPDADLSAFRILDEEGMERDPDTLALTEGAKLLVELQAAIRKAGAR